MKSCLGYNFLLYVWAVKYVLFKILQWFLTELSHVEIFTFYIFSFNSNFGVFCVIFYLLKG